MGIVVRPARADDRPAVADALGSCAAFNAEEVTVALELFDEGIAVPDSYTLLSAEVDACVQGYVCLGQAPLTQSTWYLYWVCVHRAAQGHGVGRALQRASEEAVRKRHGARLVLETSARPDYHRARRFYASAGYQRAGLIQDFYKPGDDCLILVKTLT